MKAFDEDYLKELRVLAKEAKVELSGGENHVPHACQLVGWVLSMTGGDK